MGATTRSLTYACTLNNPTPEEVRWVKENPKLDQVQCCVFTNEVGAEGTPHIQGFIRFNNQKTLSATIKWFTSPETQRRGWHLESTYSSDYANWMYSIKGEQPKDEWDEMKWEGPLFGENVNILFQYGETPPKDGEADPWSIMVNMIQSGSRYLDLVKRYPQLAVKFKSALAQYALEWDKSHMDWRDVEVIYLSGETGCGKTRLITDKYGYPNVHRVVNDKNPWDTYDGQEVVVFEEFRSQQTMTDMLNWLDGHPVLLKARYADKVAKFTRVYIVSNWTIGEQYPKFHDGYETEGKSQTWKAFLRRINTVRHFCPITNEFIEIEFK